MSDGNRDLPIPASQGKAPRGARSNHRQPASLRDPETSRTSLPVIVRREHPAEQWLADGIDTAGGERQGQQRPASGCRTVPAPRLYAASSKWDVVAAPAMEIIAYLLLRRGCWKNVLGVVSYLVFDVLVLWCAFLAVHTNPVPGFPIVIMAYIIGALGGSLPLPAAAGTIGGMAGMLILYGVASHSALAAVLLHQAIGLLVPLTGGAIAYTILRHRFGPIHLDAASDPVAPQTRARRAVSVVRDQPLLPLRCRPERRLANPLSPLRGPRRSRTRVDDQGDPCRRRGTCRRNVRLVR